MIITANRLDKSYYLIVTKTITIMKKFISYWDKKLRNDFSFWDLGMLKTYGMIPGLILGALFPDFIMDNLWIFLSVFLVLMFRYLYLLFIKK